MASTERRGLKQIFNAFKWSMQGLYATFKYEASFRLEFYLAIILTPIAIYISQSAMQLLLLLGCVLLVLILEILNSAIEAVVDMVCGEKFHELAKRAKDMGSAAVFLGQMLVVFTWGTVIYINFGANI
ncbi:Diacylglycerol kinase [hydrothermal vent metagenome]|uniref:Diacylglycerol kinase n=1 Tax=hydrothermal vent metagenome TaxID=652676 RepID=A0A3B0V9K7_9ZZZZ